MQTVSAHGAIGVLFVAASLFQGCASTNSVSDEPLLAAAATAPNSNYVANTTQKIVMSTDDKCVRTISWEPDNGVVECTGIAAKEPGSTLVSYNGRALFEFDSASLTGVGKAELDRLTTQLNAQDQIKTIEIVGHADSIGTDIYNQRLSERRAESAKRYLQRSLRSVAVSAKGMGESVPVADNATDNGRRLNRRVNVNIAAMVER